MVRPRDERIGQGVMFKIVRTGAAYAMELASPLAIYSGASVRDASLEQHILQGLKSGGLLRLKSVRRDSHETGDACVVYTEQVCLSLVTPLRSSHHQACAAQS